MLTGIRYTDFQVNEIDKDGKVIHLNALRINAKDSVKPVSLSSIYTIRNSFN